MPKQVALELFPFTAGNDTASWSGGWYLAYGGSVVDTLAGNDKILANVGASSSIVGIQIENGGGLVTGEGKDVITGISGKGDGISNYGSIFTGTGDDIILGTGGGYAGIYNSGHISMGTGNDKLTGTLTTPNEYGGAVINYGTIDMGDGNDIIDALNGGFQKHHNSGIIIMGNGNDTVKGFGSTTAIGGAGTDRLVFNSGTYVVAKVTDIPGAFFITNGNTFANLGTTPELIEMLVSGFERITVGSANFTFRAGSFTG